MGLIPEVVIYITPETTSESTQLLREIFPEVKGGRCVGLTAVPLLPADCLEIWEPQLSGTLRACNRPDLPLPISVGKKPGNYIYHFPLPQETCTFVAH